MDSRLKMALGGRCGNRVHNGSLASVSRGVTEVGRTILPEKCRNAISEKQRSNLTKDSGSAASTNTRQYVVLRNWLFGFASGTPTLSKYKLRFDKK